MKTLNNSKYHHAIFLKFVDLFFTSLTKLVIEAKTSIFSTIKKINFILSYVFGIFIAVMNERFLITKVCITNKHCL